MQLDYLDFDFSDEESGRGSFDAMASVVPQRLAAVLAEITQVLKWAGDAFGPAGDAQGEGDWDFELQATTEPDMQLLLAWHEAARELSLVPAPDGVSRITVSLTLSGSQSFCDALREEIGGN